jgi:hypothetical protein
VLTQTKTHQVVFIGDERDGRKLTDIIKRNLSADRNIVFLDNCPAARVATVTLALQHNSLCIWQQVQARAGFRMGN